MRRKFFNQMYMFGGSQARKLAEICRFTRNGCAAASVLARNLNDFPGTQAALRGVF
jgi:hypothetical protein